MLCPVRVTCRDAVVTAWLEGWLADGALEPPRPLTIAVELRDPPPDDPAGALRPFEQPGVVIRAGAEGVRIRWRHGPAVAEIPAGGVTASLLVGAEALKRRGAFEASFLTAVFVFLMRRAGWHHVHAATAVDPRGRGWLFAGNAQAGKSTTAARLATLGWGVGGDDLVFLDGGGAAVDVVARRARIALRPDAHRLLGRAGGTAAAGGRKLAFWPEELGGRWTQRVRPDVIALPVVSEGATRLEPVAPRTALAELVRWSAWVVLEPALADEHLALLTRLAAQAPCYRLTLGPDMFDDRDLLQELLP